MHSDLITLLTAFTGSLGFALLFGSPRRYLLPSSLGGMLSWGIFLLLQRWLQADFLSCLLASAAAVIYAEILAHRLRTPATLFVIPAILPLVPGSSLYYAMNCVVRKDLASAREYGSLTLEYALAIAVGISLVTVLRQLQARRQ